MKIAIKANADRGKEIISLLKSLGGINSKNWKGNGKRDAYYIDKNNEIQFDFPPKDYKLYTLEEFEKEFPFKIGDKVFLGEDDEYLYTIKSISIWHDGDIVYELAENELHYSADQLTLYKKMKEERNITLTLDKAKEWYNKGGELKEIALQAFTEKELNPLPRSWEEFYKRCNLVASWRYNILTKYEALYQLEQLRDCWRQGWKPKPHESVYTIKFSNGGLRVYYFSSREFLSFPTKEIAEEFLKCFRDLIEKAGDLI